MNVIDFVQKYLGEHKVVRNEVSVKICPFCNGGSHKDKYTFSINIEKGVYKCLRGKCGVSGSFSHLCKEYGEQSDATKEWVEGQKKVKYVAPKKIETSSNIVNNYLQLRKISQETINIFKIGQHKDSIVFKYFWNNEHVFNKYRYARKIKKGEDRGMRRDKDTKPIFYGMDNTIKNEVLIITEGEIDTLSIYESGFHNVVSLPSGSSDLTLLENCWEWLKENFTNIIIWVDKDDAGEKLTERLIERLIEFKLFTVDSPEKDANLVLYKHGKEKILSIISNAKEVCVNGLIDLSDVEDKNYSQLDRVPSVFPEVNKQLGGFEMGMVTILTGKNGSGKSTYLGNEILHFGSVGYPVCVYSGELPKIMFKRWLTLQASGSKYLEAKYDNTMGEEIYYVPKQIKSIINDWYYGKFKLIDLRSGIATDKQLLNIFMQAHYKYGCKIFIIDNLLTTFFTSNERDLNIKQTIFIAEISAFAKQHNSHVIIVAHPRKTQSNVTKEDVGGSGNITNLADNVLNFHRNNDDEVSKRNCNSILEILKNRELGVINKMVPLDFDIRSKRFYPANQITFLNRNTGWEKS